MLACGHLMLAEEIRVDRMDTNKKVGRRILEAREGAGYTQEELGKPIGYTKYAVSKWESGERSVSIDVLTKIARALNKPFSYFIRSDIEGLCLDPKFSDVMTNLDFAVIPLYGTVNAGTPAFTTDKPMDYITMPREMLKSASFGVKVKGDSMTGIGIEDGDTLLVRRQDFADHGDIVVARVNGDEYTIKRLKLEGETAILEPANPVYSPIVSEDLHIVGRVVRIVRDV